MDFAVKEVLAEEGRYRVRGYSVLWGGLDLDEQYFTKSTDGLLALYNAVGKLPWMYDHATNGKVKYEVVGLIDDVGEDEWGQWYEAEIVKHELYKKAVRPLIHKRSLGSSSSTLPLAGKAKGGEITQWVICEVSGTVRPADPRHVMTEEELKAPEVIKSFGFDEVEDEEVNDTESTDSSDNDEMSLIKATIGIEKMRLALETVAKKV